MLPPFALYRPQGFEEVADLLAEHRGQAALYAGGTELLLLLKEGLLRVRSLVDVKRLEQRERSLGRRRRHVRHA